MSKIMREKYPEAWKRWKDKYYRGNDFGDGKMRRFSEEEDIAILKHEVTDRVMAERFHRSLESIQLRRYKLMSGKVKACEYGAVARLLEAMGR